MQSGVVDVPDCEGSWNKMMFLLKSFYDSVIDLDSSDFLSWVVSRISVYFVFHSVVQQIYFFSAPLNQRSVLSFKRKRDFQAHWQF